MYRNSNKIIRSTKTSWTNVQSVIGLIIGIVAISWIIALQVNLNKTNENAIEILDDVNIVNNTLFSTKDDLSSVSDMLDMTKNTVDTQGNEIVNITADVSDIQQTIISHNVRILELEIFKNASSEDSPAFGGQGFWESAFGSTISNTEYYTPPFWDDANFLNISDPHQLRIPRDGKYVIGGDYNLYFGLINAPGPTELEYNTRITTSAFQQGCFLNKKLLIFANATAAIDSIEVGGSFYCELEMVEGETLNPSPSRLSSGTTRYDFAEYAGDFTIYVRRLPDNTPISVRKKRNNKKRIKF